MMKMPILGLFPLLILVNWPGQFARGEEPGFSLIDTVVLKGIAEKKAPGAVVSVLHQGQVVYLKALGNRAIEPTPEPMTSDTIFDLASLTKPIATATALFTLVDAGQVRLGDRVSVYWPEFAQNGKENITLEHLLTHTSGLIADNALADYQQGKGKALEKICGLQVQNPPGERFTYSDVGFIVLGEIVARVSGKPLDHYSQEKIFKPLGMDDTGFNPPARVHQRCAPTQKTDGVILRGVVHDPRARLMDGVAGHAGLFSTQADLVRYAEMILGNGARKGIRILSPAAVRAMTTPRPVPRGWRTFGWDADTAFSSNRGELFPKRTSFGHTGFTGTSIWFDPASGTAVLFLSNRVHPDGKGDVGRLRGQVATLVAGQLLQGKKPPSQTVATGIDILQREQFARLKGATVGLVTNHSGRNSQGASAIDLLHKAPGVKLAALFSPEHGIRGAVDAKVADSIDEKTGLPVFSLYGERRKPAPEQLKGIDTLVYDIQDAGCRYYTYISTLGLVMDAAAEANLRLIVLDRPNPIGGLAFNGPMLDPGKESFVAFHRLPVRHSLTIGELAKLFHQERETAKKCRLEVVAMEGWKRAALFDATGLEWVYPSPNLRTLSAALLYPGIGLLETTNLSVGRGTDRPFEWIGAPWMNGVALAQLLNSENLPGLRFVPFSQTPVSSVLAGKKCNGVQIFVDDWKLFEPLRAGMAVAWALRKLHPNDWKMDRYNTLLANQATFDAIKEGKHYLQIESSWRRDLADYAKRRAGVLLYPEE